MPGPKCQGGDTEREVGKVGLRDHMVAPIAGSNCYIMFIVGTVEGAVATSAAE